MRPSVSDLLGLENAPAAAPFVVDAATLADIIGCTASTIRRLAADGVIQRAGPNAFDLRSAVRRYIANRNVEKPGAGDRARREKAEADLSELKAAQLGAKLLDAGEVEREWANTLRDLRAAILALPGRVGARLPHLSKGDLAALDGELREALAAMGGADD